MGENSLDITAVINFKSPPLPFFIECKQTLIAKGKGYPSRSYLGVFNLVYVREGELSIEENNITYSVLPGEYIILRPDTKYRSNHMCSKQTVIEEIQFSTTGAWEERDASKSQTLFGDYYSHIVHIKKKHAMLQRDKLEGLLDRLSRAAREGDAHAFWDRQQYFIQLLKCLDDEWRSSEARATVLVAEKAAAFIKTHYTSNITNAYLAEQLGYHINYIARSMDEVFSMTPQQYLMYYRIDQAKLLLIQTELTIAQIAASTGFKQTPHFSRLFASQVGIAPLRYRKKYTT